MSDSIEDPGRLDDLIHKYCDDSLDEAGHRELERLLSTSDAAAKRYIEVVQVWSGLMDWAETKEAHDESTVREKTVVLSSPPSHKKSWFGFLAIAAALAFAFLVGAYYGNALRDEQPTLVQQQNSSDRQESYGASIDQSQLKRYVARVVEVTEDVSWGDSKPEEFLLRLAKGEQLELKTGDARIEFAAGASVILKGPARLELLAGDTARLHRGQLTGRAKDGNFKLLTDAAEVIDLGTEFGVSVDDLLNTDVCVFDGEVDVNVAGGLEPGEEVSSVRLTEGMAVRVASNGLIDESYDVSRSNFRRHSTQVARMEDEQGLISLVDIIAGGDGRSARVAGAIDPRTGDWDSEVLSDPELVRDRLGDGKYKLSVSWPYIDGVFIPSSDGLNTQLDSEGRLFNLGQNDGKTWGPIWSRRHIPNLRSVSGGVSDFWGTDTLEGILDLVEKSKYGVVGLHPNVGMTIDLQAVRMLEGKPLTRFQTEIANLDNSATRMPDYAAENRPSVDFSVFVDGRLEYVRGHFARDEGNVDVDIPLSPEARFLTLASTDGGNSFWFDHLVLIDPVLLLESP